MTVWPQFDFEAAIAQIIAQLFGSQNKRSDYEFNRLLAIEEKRTMECANDLQIALCHRAK